MGARLSVTGVTGGAWRCLAPLVVAGHPSRVYRGSGGQRRL